MIEDSRSGREWRAEGIDASVDAETLIGPGHATATMVLDGKPIEVNGRAGTVGERCPHGEDIDPLARLSPSRCRSTGPTISPGPNAAKLPGRRHARRHPAEGPEGAALAVDGFSRQRQVRPDAPVAQARPDADLLRRDRAAAHPRGFRQARPRQSSRASTLPSRPARSTLTARSAAAPKSPFRSRRHSPRWLTRCRACACRRIAGELHLDAQGVVVGGGVVQAVGVDLATAEDGWEIENLTAVLPGETPGQSDRQPRHRNSSDIPWPRAARVAPAAGVRVVVARRDRLSRADRPLRGGSRSRFRYRGPADSPTSS